MLEIIKEAGTMLKDLPDLAIWILIGILFYKTLIIGSIFGVVKLVIIKTHDAITKPKVEQKSFTLDGRFICHDGTYDRFISFIDKVVRDNEVESSHKGKYLHRSDVDFIMKAYEEKRDRDNK